jgi:hypothetical protein
VDGHCALSGAGIHASYTGQAVTCEAERDLNGQLSEGYCTMAAGEAVLDCCELAGGEDKGSVALPLCATAHPLHWIHWISRDYFF